MDPPTVPTRRRRWWAPAGATVVLGAAALVAIARRDPSWGGTALWLASMSSAVVAAVVHDRGSGWWRRFVRAADWRWIDTAALIVLTAVALAIRVHRLGPTLPYVHGDEGEMGLLARRALDASASGARPLPVFGTEFLDQPTLFHYLQAGALAAFGDSITGLRLLSAGFGAVAAPAVYLIGRLGWGRVAGTAAGWLLCVSHFHIHYSRIALNNIESSSSIAVAMVLVLVAVTLGRADARTSSSTPRVTIFVLLGLTVGVSQYLYYGSRLLLLLMVPMLLVLLGRGLARRRDIGAAVGAAIVAVLPLVRHYLLRPASLTNRTTGVSVLATAGVAHELGSGATLPHDLLRLLARQLRRNVAFFIDSGDHSAFYTADVPAFDRVTLVLFWLGVVLALGSALSRRTTTVVPARLVLMWIVLGVTLGGVLTIDSPNGPRLLMIVPAVFVFGGVSSQYLWNAACRRWPSRRSARRGVVAVVASTIFFTNWNRYFVDYDRGSALARTTEIAMLIRDQNRSHRVFLIGGDALLVANGAVRFITDGGDQSDLASADDFETRFPELLASGRPVVVIALAFRTADLERIRLAHPGGTLTTYDDPEGRPSYLTYELVVDASRVGSRAGEAAAHGT